MEDRNEEAIFNAAMELADPAERGRFVAQACGGNARLLADVESLLRSHDSRSLLDVPVLDAGVVTNELPVTEGPGTVIGRYKLLEKIGEGGMAVVYMAEQAEPIRRKVALKIIKLGMDTRQVIARFEAEQQALALMDHPSIARVLDAGATETGRPYFVMELVQGVSITEYCDKNNLCTKGRLALFIQVCQAVQHAHTKGIIHRDIKPSNVMVTHHDGKPVPKVIDFGIAKATNQRLTEKTLFTRYAHIIGTPAYMSPEQAELSDLDIDTRTDIYSLGVLLYELLTGTTPFSEEELRKAGYIEMQRVIREQEPVKPSTRIRTAHVAQPRGEGILPLRVAGILPAIRGRDALDTKNKAGTASPPQMCTPYQQVRGDLDWIVMKTLEKDRLRRYEAAEILAADIQRHLQHMPVLARAPSAGYRLQKLLRRHRSQAIAALAIAVVAATVILALSLRARDQVQLARDITIKQANILAQARNLIAKNDYAAARTLLRPLMQIKHVDYNAWPLFAMTLVDGHDPDGDAKDINAIMEEHYLNGVKYWTRKIAANPEEQNNYVRRAKGYYYLHDIDNVNADMSQYATIATKGAFNGVQLGFPKNLGPVINTSTHDVLLWLSSDDLSLWFQRTVSDSSSHCEFFLVRRETKDSPWGTPESLGVGVDMNSKALSNSALTTQSFDRNPGVDLASIFKKVGIIPGITSDDGLEMYFSQYTIVDEYTGFDLWMMRREALDADWGELESLKSINTKAGEVSPTISPDGTELYFGSSATAMRSGSFGLSDIWVSKRARRGDPWEEPKNLVTVNTQYRDHFPVLSGDGLLLFFYSDRPGGYGQRDLYVTRRKSMTHEWCPPVNLGPFVNNVGNENGIYMSGSTVFFNSDKPGGHGGQDIWEVQILHPPDDAGSNKRAGSNESARDSGTGKEVTTGHDR